MIWTLIMWFPSIMPGRWEQQNGRRPDDAYYNDWDNLILVSKGENRSKETRVPEYLPPRESFLCEYVQRWEFIKKMGTQHTCRAQKIAELNLIIVKRFMIVIPLQNNGSFVAGLNARDA